MLEGQANFGRVGGSQALEVARDAAEIQAACRALQGGILQSGEFGRA